MRSFSIYEFPNKSKHSPKSYLFLNWNWHSDVAIWAPLFASRITSGSLVHKLLTFLPCRRPFSRWGISMLDFPWMKFILVASRTFLFLPLRQILEGSISIWPLFPKDFGAVGRLGENVVFDIVSCSVFLQKKMKMKRCWNYFIRSFKFSPFPSKELRTCRCVWSSLSNSLWGVRFNLKKFILVLECVEPEES